MKTQLAGLLALLALTAGCASAPVRQSVDLGLKVPENWTAVETIQGDPRGLWWTTFDDPTLNDLVAEVLANNHDLKAAAARVDSAAALARIAGADRKPSVNAAFGASRGKQIFLGLPIPGGGGIPSSTSTSLGLSLETFWEMDLWGRLKAGKEAAIADLQAAEADFAAVRLSLTGQTAKVWFALAEVKQQVDLAERTVKSFHETVEFVRRRFERGLRPAIDLRLALTNLHAAEASLERRRIERAALVRQLEVLVARYPEGVIEERTSIPEVPEPVPAGLPAELVRRRPDLVSAERRLAAADKRVAEARRALYPSFTLALTGGTSSNELQDLVDLDFNVWSIILNLFQPIYQGGRLRANVELQDARAVEAAETFISLVIQAFAEVETTLETEVLLVELERSLRDASIQAAAARVLAEDRYVAGLDTFLTVLESQVRDFEAESRLLEVQRQRLDARIDLFLALGGGFEYDWTEWQQENES